MASIEHQELSTGEPFFPDMEGLITYSRAEVDEDDNKISLLQALEKKQMREADALKLIDAQVCSFICSFE